MQESTCSRQYSEITARIHDLRQELGKARGIEQSTRVAQTSFWKGNAFPYDRHPFSLPDNVVAIQVDIENLYRARIQVDCRRLANPSGSDAVSVAELERTVGTMELQREDFVDLTVFVFLHGAGHRRAVKDFAQYGMEDLDDPALFGFMQIPDWETLSRRFTGENIQVRVSAARRERRQRVHDLEEKLVREITRRNQLCRQQNLFFWATPPDERPQGDDLVRLLQDFKTERSSR
jgi:hypothetical protein